MDIQTINNIAETIFRGVLDGETKFLLIGKLGTGKTMVAKRVHDKLCDLVKEISWYPKKAQERRQAFRLCGINQRHDLMPFRAPHHTCHQKGLIGDLNQLGEIVLARHGILHLSDIHEMRKSLIEKLVQTLNKGTVDYNFLGQPVSIPIASTIIIADAEPPNEEFSDVTKKLLESKIALLGGFKRIEF